MEEPFLQCQDSFLQLRLMPPASTHVLAPNHIQMPGAAPEFLQLQSPPSPGSTQPAGLERRWSRLTTPGSSSQSPVYLELRAGSHVNHTDTGCGGSPGVEDVSMLTPTSPPYPHWRKAGWSRSCDPNQSPVFTAAGRVRKAGVYNINCKSAGRLPTAPVYPAYQRPRDPTPALPAPLKAAKVWVS